MGLLEHGTKQADRSDPSSKTILSFDLFPDQKLHLQLLSGVSTPHKAASQISSTRFSLLDAHRIVSIGHVAIAAQHALLRTKNMKLTMENSNGNNKNQRSLAMETIVCAGGSSHVGNVLRDFAFLEKKDTNKNEGNDFAVLVLGWNCTEIEMTNFVNEIIREGEGRPTPLSYLSRVRTKEEETDLIKTFKLMKEDIDAESSSLELAIITRVATKYML